MLILAVSPEDAEVDEPAGLRQDGSSKIRLWFATPETSMVKGLGFAGKPLVSPVSFGSVVSLVSLDAAVS